MLMSIIPFPRSRNRRFIIKHAVRMAKLPARTAEKHLAHQLQVQAQTMAGRGIAPEVVESELRTLENAIRAELWCVVMSGGDAA
jgi:hypothetical protein